MYQNIRFCVKCGAELIIKDDRENKERPHCENCGWIYYKNPIPAAACVVINEQNELLLVKRK
ncbi:MAG TPA: zinc ribbon domain-containing protein, partial [Candidatus Cloacimonadota bacterium]|nr:zinc ribbon domain-containing protein [Candidatus Cloacimonadota bacterium]